jgi:DNA-binding MarR family transcriptional regulator
MPPGPKIASRSDAAAALVAVGPLVALWLERLLSGHDPPLTAGQFLALGAIDRGPVSAAELARRTGVSGPAVSQLLAALDRDGLIERSPAQDDRRRRVLALSVRGRMVQRSAAALLNERLGTLLEPLPAPEADALARALPAVQAALSGTPPPRRGPPA